VVVGRRREELSTSAGSKRFQLAPRSGEPGPRAHRARAIAREIAENTAPVATVLTRQLMWRASAADTPQAALSVDSALNLALASSGDVKEGFAAFREKRLPNFPGSASKDLPSPFPWW